ncbi:phosphate ABC transporter permease subunit PstC [Thermosulfuriphilus ammonigenes]|uniref:Phosphate transport system permease protein n=1 Tax=Thermosulfuriphilus ammonigenes TaxID=1936021 RepID=A0A6G7PU18_9BACT|nr:phosphate ABC transporter permease subunit PstC [Thermosulfuriphilus ammonigenes]MBA2848795.1 phosphate transport system permease protein [Thermosulfuriphilus ammonigenes]QIJ71077.1 phosphate ABC transporter permease subunit PstC [Thermosulfuriphilus ammonigenes]
MLLVDQIFARAAKIFALAVVLLVIAIFITLIYASWPAIRTFGLSFISGTTWDPVFEKFGALPFIAGTLITSFLAIFLTLPFAIGGAIYLGEYAPKRIAEILGFIIELLAGIPSVIYGLWGIFFLVPLMRQVQMALGYPPYGVGLMTASLILALMILPYAASVARDVIKLVPRDLKEAAYGLGATQWEVVRYVVLPYASSGIFAGIILALGRALGETMAVTMVIGNRSEIPENIFSPANTMASVIANEFTEATSDIYLASLVEIGLLLFVITLIVNIAARIIINRLAVVKKGVS